MKHWLHRRVVAPIVQLLLQGITPRKIAQSMAVGLCLSTFPLLGVTSLLCLAAAIRLRLNVVAIQLVNWLAAPLQVALLIPFYRMGIRLFSLPDFPMTPQGMIAAFREDFLGTFAGMWMTVAGGAAIWLALIVPVSLLFFVAMDAALRRWKPAGEAVPGHA